jgi:hypothetical protein
MTQYNIGDKVIYIGVLTNKSGVIERVLERGLLIRWDWSVSLLANPTVVSFAKLDRLAKVCNNETFT